MHPATAQSVNSLPIMAITAMMLSVLLVVVVAAGGLSP